MEWFGEGCDYFVSDRGMWGALPAFVTERPIPTRCVSPNLSVFRALRVIKSSAHNFHRRSVCLPIIMGSRVFAPEIKERSVVNFGMKALPLNYTSFEKLWHQNCTGAVVLATAVLEPVPVPGCAGASAAPMLWRRQKSGMNLGSIWVQRQSRQPFSVKR